MKTYMNCASSLYRSGGPEHLVLVIDVSASMECDDFRPSRLHAAVNAACALVGVKRDHHGGDFVGVVTFSDVSRSAHALSSVRESSTSLERSIRSLRTELCTDIGAGLREAARMLGRQRPRALGGEILGRVGRWLLGGSESPARASDESLSNARIILLSDGGDTSDSGPRALANSLKGQGVVIDTIGIGGSPEDVDEALLREIASARSDGSKRYCFIKDSEHLVQKFESLAGRLRPMEA